MIQINGHEKALVGSFFFSITNSFYVRVLANYIHTEVLFAERRKNGGSRLCIAGLPGKYFEFCERCTDDNWQVQAILPSVTSKN